MKYMYYSPLNLIVFILILFIQLAKTDEIILSNLTSYSGDSFISNESFIKSINNTCKTKDLYSDIAKQKNSDQCVLSKIKFEYEHFANRGFFLPETELDQNKKIYLYRSNELSIYIKKTKKVEEYGDLHFEMFLFTEKNNKTIDSILLYKEENKIDSFSSEIQYYFIDESFNIWTLAVGTFEEGTILYNWKKYNVNKGEGVFLLLEFYNCTYEVADSGDFLSKCNYVN